MQISFEGAFRFSGSHELMNNDLSELRLGRLGPARADIDKTSGALEIISTTGSERLGGGRYRIRVRLSKKEITNLAKIALRNDPLGVVVDALAACNECQSRAQRELDERVRNRREERRRLFHAANAGQS